MTNAITVLPIESFKLSRTSKSGKVTQRNLLGLIIEGTNDERFETGLVLAREAWDSGKTIIVLDTLARVFAGRSWDISIAFVGLDVKNPNKEKLVQLMEALCRFHADAKGIKAKYVKLCADIVVWAKDEATRKEARRLAFEAAAAQQIAA